MSKLQVVTYRAFGREVPALVLAAREGEVSHLGSSGEPILTVAFLDPARETGLSQDKDGNFVYGIGRIPQVFIEHDVVHASHEFSKEFKTAKGISTPAHIASVRGHGEWTEYEGVEARKQAARADQAEAERDVAVGLWSSAPARADHAEAERDAVRKEFQAYKDSQADPA